MLKLPSLSDLDAGMGVRIFLCTTPTDMRKGFDTLAALVREGLGGDPLSGHLFLFVGRRKDRIKLLYWDKDGYALWYKRLEKGTFRLPAPRRAGENGKYGAMADSPSSVELRASELAMLLEGIDLRSIKRRRRFVHIGGKSRSM